jgi:hypothetical protein
MHDPWVLGALVLCSACGSPAAPSVAPSAPDDEPDAEVMLAAIAGLVGAACVMPRSADPSRAEADADAALAVVGETITIAETVDFVISRDLGDAAARLQRLRASGAESGPLLRATAEAERVLRTSVDALVRRARARSDVDDAALECAAAPLPAVLAWQSLHDQLRTRWRLAEGQAPDPFEGPFRLIADDLSRAETLASEGDTLNAAHFLQDALRALEQTVSPVGPWDAAIARAEAARTDDEIADAARELAALVPAPVTPAVDLSRLARQRDRARAYADDVPMGFAGEVIAEAARLTPADGNLRAPWRRAVALTEVVAACGSDSDR